MKSITNFFLILVIVSLASCVLPPGRNMTPLEIRGIQTREFEEDKSIVFASVIAVFQDLGYIITNADKDTGLISADSASQSNTAIRILLGVTQVKQTKTTGFVERIGKITRVRLNFVETLKSSSAYGQGDRQDSPILDSKIYQNAFERIENAIFVRKGG